MKKRKVYFRADASVEIGYGHFIRLLALADMLKDDFDCVFYTVSPTEYQCGEMEKVCRYVVLNEGTKFEDFLAALTGEEIVVLDNYFYTTDYQRAVKEKGCKLVCIDDMHDKHYVADVVINPVLDKCDFYDIEKYTRLCLGLEYALLRKPFVVKTNVSNKKKNSWLIAFGGSDVDNNTERFLSVLNSDDRVDSISVIVGDAYRYLSSIKKYEKATVYQNLSAEQVSAVMRWSEYAVLSASTICIEALASQCKVACGYYIDNQKDAAMYYKNTGLCIGLDNINAINSFSFIDKLLAFQLQYNVDFCSIPSRYADVFNAL